MKVEEVPSQIAEIFETIQNSIGEKFSNLIFAIFTCIGGILYSLVKGPMFALMCLSYIPVFLAILAIFGRMVRNATIQKLEVVKSLGGVAEETLTAIKIVQSFGREDREIYKFNLECDKATQFGKKH